ncbi:hypothetical protein B9Z55_028607 [Caenorhabditis nigoni]|uniref:Uncharacterized protein n=1 Tax=Caenorhabditis nigoni TaxID=1611254 RepID=A0A2G5SB56_9PELO|nr:hypothetical protein B9Z55_028607 [Caenorhabditis nigoni]
MRLKIYVTLFLLVVSSVKVKAGSERFQPDWYKKLIASLFTKPREAKAIPQEPRYCFRCTSGTFDDHRELMTGPIQYKLTTWREDWVETDCLQAKGTYQYCEGRCVFVTVSRHLPDQQTYQAEGILSDCADDLFRWGTDLPFFMGDRTSDNKTLKTYTDGYEITFDFTLHTTNYTEIYKDHVGKVLRRHVYESYETSTVIIYVVFLAVISFLTGCICFWCCLLSIDERLRRLNRRREYIARMLTYDPATSVSVELANYNGGGVIDEVDTTQDSSVLEQHHREKLYNTEDSDIDEHESVNAMETVEEPSDAKTIKDAVQEMVYKIEEEEKLNG